jgi:hypothetical protein
MAGGRKKPILTEEQRARLIEAGKAGRDALKKWRDQRAQGQDLTLNEAIPPKTGGDWGGREAIVLPDRRVGLNEEQAWRLDIGPVHRGQGDFLRFLTTGLIHGGPTR